MSDTNTPQGIGLTDAQNAISAMFAPQEDNAEATDALETEAETEEQDQADVEMADEEIDNSPVEGSEVELDEEDDADSSGDQSFDILSATVEVDGEEITVEDLKSGHLRHRDYTRKTQELAEMRKSYAAEAEAIERERAQYAQLLPALSQQIEQSVQDEPDWDTLYDTDPTMAAKAERQWRKQQEQKNAQMQAVQAEQARLRDLQQKKMQQMEQQYLEEQRSALPDLIPEWRDQKVASTEAGQIRDFLLTEGFNENDVQGLKNATLVKLARKAMLYDRGETRANEAKVKPKKPRSKTLKAGSRGSAPKPKTAAQEAQQRLQKSGRVQDAAVAIKALL